MPHEEADPAEWVRYSRTDLKTAELLLQRDDEFLSTVGFHAQQAVEKALKAHLAMDSAPVPKVHSVDYLIGLCAASDSAFEQFRAAATALTVFAVTYRYPGAEEPSREFITKAVSTARAVLAYVERRIRPGG